jgi:hydroxybutyrate-dimer hydrolase
MLKTADRFSSPRILPLFALAAATLAACGGGGGNNEHQPDPNVLPQGVTQHSVTAYTATAKGSGTTADTQDLLTGGIGKSGLEAAAAPAYADIVNPTALELRRNALYSNYRAILDYTSAGGYGRFYGPNVTTDRTVTTGEGLIPGREYIASLDDGTGHKRVVMAVQIPDSFDRAKPCIVLGPSSGSRGVYGAIGTAGEWGLKHGCAVALTDAGKGVGLHDLGDDTVNKIDGTRATRTAAGALAQFAADITEAARVAFNAALPNRFALKHVHSQKNPEKDWGTDTLVAARYALYAINDSFGMASDPVPFNAGNTLVIAGSASNGGAAVVRAAEQDTEGLIDGVVASEPVIELPTTMGYGVQFNGVAVSGVGRTLADFVTYGNLYQPCAQLAAGADLTGEASYFNWMGATGMNTRAQARCSSLAAKGLVTGGTLAAQSADALARLHAYGWTPEHDQMHNSYWGLGNGPILSAMYPVAYGRFSVVDNVCGASFSAVDPAGTPIPTTPTAKAQSFATANGTANGTPVSVVYDNSFGGPKGWQFAISASNGAADFGLDTALCQRALVTGVDPLTGATLTSSSTPSAAQSAAVQAGIREVVFNGNLRGKPTLIVSGRSDALVPVNNNARAYAAYNRVVEGGTNLRYIEVLNGQHFDTFIPLGGFDNRFIPLHVYFNQAMDLMYAHLTAGAALPPSQVVRTTQRGGTPSFTIPAPALSAANIPPISASPAAADQIGFSGTSLAVPQ